MHDHIRGLSPFPGAYLETDWGQGRQRLKILRALQNAKGPLSQGAVSEAAGLSQANASKHLALLVRVGLVLRDPTGNTVYFRPVMPLVADLCNLVCGHVSGRARTSYQALK